MDWDDDDEKTTLWDKDAQEDASRDLLRSAPPPPIPAAGMPARTGDARALASASGGAAAALPRPGLPPAPALMPSVPAALPAAVPSAGGKTLLTLIALAAAALACVAAYLFLFPRAGTLVVTVAGPNDEAVEKVQVLVDQKVVCTTPTCRVEKLAAGTHIVSVTADGYKQTADKAISIEKGANVVLPVTLLKKSRGTGIRVATLGTGLRLSVNGHDEGPLPVELKDMEPGEYTIRISGSDRYDVHEEKVKVEADKITSVEPKLKVIKGLAHIKPGPGAAGARVLLVSGRERRPLPKLPIKIDIKPEKPYTLVAKKKGYRDYSKRISFEDGKAEKTFEIILVQEGDAEPPEEELARAPAKRGRAAPRKPGAPKKPAAARRAGGGRLNINSIPASNVILDGRPLGQTPKIGISVKAGPHTVMFVHPEHGRKIQTVNVKPGGTMTAAVRFP